MKDEGPSCEGGVMKKIVFVVTALMALALLSACKPKEVVVTQKLLELEAGQTIELNELVEADEDTTVEIIDNPVDPTKPGDYTVTVRGTTGKQTKDFTFTVTVVDSEAPQLIQMGAPVVKIGETFNVEDYLQIIENTDASTWGELVVGPIDTSKAGEFSVQVSLTDGSGHTGTLEFFYWVVKPNVLIPEEIYTLKYQFENGTTHSFKVTFHGVQIADTLSSLTDHDGKKYVALDLTIENLGSGSFDFNLFMSGYELGDPGFMKREIQFIGGKRYDISYDTTVGVTTDSAYQKKFAAKSVWRIYWYVEVDDDQIELPFTINIPINRNALSYDSRLFE